MKRAPRAKYELYDVLINGRTYARFTERRHAELFIRALGADNPHADYTLRIVLRSDLR